MGSSKLTRNRLSGACGIITITLVILLASLFFTSCNNSSEPKERELIGYAIINGERYDITRYATNHGLPYVETIDGMKICGAGITVFIPND